jgi:hypothetical protein
MSENHDMPDAAELKEIMKIMTQTVPDLLGGINKAFFDPQESLNRGNSIASFYSTLVQSGVPKDQAFELTRSYMSSTSLGGLISNLVADL